VTTFSAFQFSLSTAEDARSYFSGAAGPTPEEQQQPLPDGSYRVVDGVLCRVLPGVPQRLDDAPRPPACDGMSKNR
jgi:hypothetical protein